MRRVAVELGKGRMIGVRTADGRNLKGRIAKVETDQLILSRGANDLATIPYVEVRELKSRTSGTVKGITLAAIGGVAVTVLVVLGTMMRND